MHQRLKERKRDGRKEKGREEKDKNRIEIEEEEEKKRRKEGVNTCMLESNFKRKKQNLTKSQKIIFSFLHKQQQNTHHKTTRNKKKKKPKTVDNSNLLEGKRIKTNKNGGKGWCGSILIKSNQKNKIQTKKKR